MKLNFNVLVSSPAPKYPVGGDQPQVNPGSPTYPLDVSAALTGDGSTLTIAVVNPSESTQRLDLTIQGVELRGNGHRWSLTGPDLDAMTGLTRHDVQVTEAPVAEVPTTLELAPFSINLYAFEKR
ncbi:MAG: hypothetical protein P8Y94_05890 [Acidobacteriota bacterium]